MQPYLFSSSTDVYDYTRKGHWRLVIVEGRKFTRVLQTNWVSGGLFFLFLLSVEQSITCHLILLGGDQSCVIWPDGGGGGGGGGDHLFPRAVPDHLLMSRHSRYSRFFLWTKWQIISLWMIHSHTRARAHTHGRHHQGKVIVCWQHLRSTLRHNGSRDSKQNHKLRMRC